MARPYTKDERAKKKKLFLEAMETSKGMVTTSAERAGISAETVSNWRKADKKFDADVKEIQDKVKEYVEGKLMTLIEQNNTAAIMFFLKCRCGYHEKQRLEVEKINDVDVQAAIKEIKEQLATDGK